MRDARPSRSPLELPAGPRRLWIGAVYVVLFGLSVPWYLRPSDEVSLWFGLPHWVAISIAGSVGVAVFTAFVVTRFWPTDVAADPQGDDGTDPGDAPVSRGRS